jgi:hypothetical protein
MYKKDNKTEDWKDLINLESIDTTKFDEMTKKNERNAGRKKVLNGQRVIITVPKDKVQELKDFAKSLITYEKK